MLDAEKVLDELSTLKVLVFMEAEPLTDKFEQVMFTKEQAKKMRDGITKALVPAAKLNADVSFEIITNDKLSITLPNVKDCYSEKELEA